MSAGNRFLATVLWTTSALAQQARPPQSGLPINSVANVSQLPLQPSITNKPLTEKDRKLLDLIAKDYGLDHYVWLNDPGHQNTETERQLLDHLTLTSERMKLKHVPNLIIMTPEKDEKGHFKHSGLPFAKAFPNNHGWIIVLREDALSSQVIGMTVAELGKMEDHEAGHVAQGSHWWSKKTSKASINCELDADTRAVQVDGDSATFLSGFTKLDAYERKQFADNPSYFLNSSGKTFDEWESSQNDAHPTFAARTANAGSATLRKQRLPQIPAGMK